MASLVYLGFSVVIFIISYGIMFLLTPAILGVFFSLDLPISDPEWAALDEEMQTQIQWLIPLIPTIGILILVIKVLMVASVRGSD